MQTWISNASRSQGLIMTNVERGNDEDSIIFLC